ncbi:MAG: RhuM family protein, partial [Paludibacteraceae bacterium]|nr:RhuM family protein [Paludibacteraceae bacterium]
MKDEIVLYQPNETIQLEVHLKDETVWLSQQQMAELFATDRTSILRHIGNIYKTHELDESATCAKIAQVRQEGGRTIVRQIPFYNLDMIISVGYRVNSIRGTRFRQWANKVIKDYMLKGYAVNQRLLNIENQLVSQQKQLAKHQEQIDFFVR